MSIHASHCLPKRGTIVVSHRCWSHSAKRYGSKWQTWRQSIACWGNRIFFFKHLSKKFQTVITTSESKPHQSELSVPSSITFLNKTRREGCLVFTPPLRFVTDPHWYSSDSAEKYGRKWQTIAKLLPGWLNYPIFTGKTGRRALTKQKPPQTSKKLLAKPHKIRATWFQNLKKVYKMSQKNVVNPKHDWCFREACIILPCRPINWKNDPKGPLVVAREI